MKLSVSVVVPVYNGSETLLDCLRALRSQSIDKAAYEIIVVDDGSTDGSADLASAAGVQAVRQRNLGAPAARNTGIQIARGTWIAFTDADCIPTRTWLASLLRRVESDGIGAQSLGAAGRTLGYSSLSPPARFVDLTFGLDAERSLAHPRFPFAPTANVMYQRDMLTSLGGFDDRFATYDACDLHYRLLSKYEGVFSFEPRAVVLHRHRPTWRAYWRQQVSYGRGYAQFVMRHRDAVRWGPLEEVRTVGKLCQLGLAACTPVRDDAGLARRGTFVKHLAQHVGFVKTYWDPQERARW